jgi:hypothetical protein
MLPVNELNVKFNKDEIAALLDFYPVLSDYNNDHPSILEKGAADKIPGIKFDFTKLDHPIVDMLTNMKSRYPFLCNTCCYLVTDSVIPSFTLHSHTDSHCHVHCVLESDNTAKTHWYKISKAPGHLYNKADVIGIVPHPDGEVTHWHTDTLLQGETYLFDSHTFHSIENLDKNRRIVFTWWLDHIAYQLAYEYYEQHSFLSK